MRKQKKAELNQKLLQFTSPKGGDNSVNFHYRVVEFAAYGNINIPNTCVKYLSFSMTSFWEMKYLSQILSEKLS